jgi:hypothetical protein
MPIDAAPPRYSSRALPVQRHLPGVTPGPRAPETARDASPFEPAAWSSHEDFLHGANLLGRKGKLSTVIGLDSGDGIAGLVRQSNGMLVAAGGSGEGGGSGTVFAPSIRPLETPTRDSFHHQTDARRANGSSPRSTHPDCKRGVIADFFSR